MSRAITFTQAKVRRAVKAAESAELRVTRVTVKPDGSIEVAAGGDNEALAVDSPAAATGKQKENLHKLIRQSIAKLNSE